jgi:hypothetical protein
MRGCHSPDSGRITASASSWLQLMRIVQRKRLRAQRERSQPFVKEGLNKGWAQG